MKDWSEKAQASILAMLAKRAADQTVCPSEVARAIANEGAFENWREAMPMVRAAVDDMLRRKIIRLSWKGAPLETRSGPYRIAYHQSSFAKDTGDLTDTCPVVPDIG